MVRDLIATAALGVPGDRLRVVTPDVGGSFGSKIFPYPEQVLVCYAARKLRRPVRWTADRSEAFLADVHGRDTVSMAELAIDADLRFTALRVRVVANLGAYLSTFAPLVPTMIGTAVLPSVYDFRSVFAEITGGLTNTAPVDAYRGAGMPETIYLVERLIDVAARELGLDRADLRGRNLVRSQAMPYRAASGSVYDSGDFARLLELAIARSGWSSFPERRSASEARGLKRGIGLACYLAATGGPPVEFAAIRLVADKVELSVGTQSSGQGHETVFARLLADRLGIPEHAIKVLQGDTDLLGAGGGTGGSRSLYAAGAAVLQAAATLIEQARPLAAEALQAAPNDIEFRSGRFAVAGTGREISLLALAAIRDERGPARSPLEWNSAADTAMPTFPNGCHVAEVEVDPETGAVDLLRYVAADDIGRIVDERLAEGQIHGGIAQGYGQAVREAACYDPSGQLLAGSFMDYAMPRAADLPSLDVAFVEIPATTNPLGTKGAGEAGAIASAAVIVSAVLDALAPEGVEHIEMPLMPPRVWETLNRAKKSLVVETTASPD